MTLLSTMALVVAAGCGNPDGAPGRLSIKSISTPGTVVKLADTWTLGATISNVGSESTQAASLYYYWSADASLDSGDYLVGGAARPVPALAPGAQYTDTYSNAFAVSEASTNPGTQYLIVETIEADGATASATATVPVAYDRMVIDAYNSTGPNLNGSNYLVLDLFDSSGDTSTGDPWTTPASSLASDGATGSGSNSVDQNLWPRIDYFPLSGIPPGTYYIRIRGYSTVSDPVDYGIRLLSAPSADHSGFYGTPPNTSDPYEPDDQEHGVPAVAATLGFGQHLFRYLDNLKNPLPEDIDWVKIVLP